MGKSGEGWLGERVGSWLRNSSVGVGVSGVSCRHDEQHFAR